MDEKQELATAGTEDSVTLTRAELYTLVWSEPMSTLAHRYGLSDVGFAKMCRRHHVPVPGVGYWARRQAGQSVGPTRLPKLSAKESERLGTLTLKSLQQRRAERAARAEEAAREAQTPAVVVVEVLTDPHPLVAQTIKVLRRVKPTKEGLLPHHGNATALDVRVSLGTVDRAMRILDALVRALEARGITLKLNVGQTATTTVATVLDEDIAFHIEERVQKVEIPVPASKRDPYWPRRPDFQSVPTGNLEFYFDSGGFYDGPRVRRSWRDGAKQHLEACLGDIVLGFFTLAGVVKDHNRVVAERLRAFEEGERKRKRQAWAERQEKRRLEVLDDQLARWGWIQDARSYVAMRRSALPADDPGRHEVEEWLHWIEALASKREHRLHQLLGPTEEPFDERFS